jgi:hypothetical protein
MWTELSYDWTIVQSDRTRRSRHPLRFLPSFSLVASGWPGLPHRQHSESQLGAPRAGGGAPGRRVIPQSRPVTAARPGAPRAGGGDPFAVSSTVATCGCSSRRRGLHPESGLPVLPECSPHRRVIPTVRGPPSNDIYSRHRIDGAARCLWANRPVSAACAHATSRARARPGRGRNLLPPPESASVHKVRRHHGGALFVLHVEHDRTIG